MAEHPILFSGPLVRAILDGRKTVTRRPATTVPGLWPSTKRLVHELDPWHEDAFRGTPAAGHGTTGPRRRVWLQEDFAGNIIGGIANPLRCPFGETGDRLWVRETWGAVDIRGYGAKTIGDVDEERDMLRYRADDHASPDYKPGIGGRWFPSIHMPRWASRLTLDVVSVRVEPVQSIDEDDARREGVEPDEDIPPGFTSGLGVDATTSRGAFAHAWAAIYGEDAWRTNPWVWRVEFKVAEVRRV